MLTRLPLSLLGKADIAQWSCKNRDLAVFTLGGSRKCCNKRSFRPKKKACPPEIRGIKGTFQDLLPPRPAPHAPLSSAGHTLSGLLSTFVCFPCSKRRKWAQALTGLLPSPPFTLTFPRKAVTGRRGHVETGLNLLKDEIGMHTHTTHKEGA